VPEILFVAKVERMPVREVLERLIAAGLDSIPGGGAEILEDDTRRRIWSRAKAPTAEWLSVHRQAHELGLRTTATMMFGVGEPLSARVEHLLGVRGVQDATGGFTAFIPWTFQAANTDLEGEVEPSGGSDYLRTLAISRLALDNIVHLQGSWVTQGEKVGQLALAFGADDLGSIMLEENVVAAAGARHRLSQRDMERIIRGAGYPGSDGPVRAAVGGRALRCSTEASGGPCPQLGMPRILTMGNRFSAIRFRVLTGDQHPCISVINEQGNRAAVTV
jgi:cyclic dehypoxanthinyl futalosine synthase